MSVSDGSILALAWNAARAVYGDLELGRADFDRFLDARGDGWRADPEARAPELYLACACLRRVPRAADIFVGSYVAPLRGHLVSRTASPDLVSDLSQHLAERMIVGERGHAPLLEAYTGRGSLAAFVRVAASRMAIDLQRGAHKPVVLDAAIEEELVGEDGELTLLKQAYRVPFREAFASAIAALTRDQRAVMRLHYVERMTLEQIARMRRVGRATVIRRLREAREALLTRLQSELSDRLGISGNEVQELAVLVRSQLDVSLGRLLGETIV